MDELTAIKLIETGLSDPGKDNQIELNEEAVFILCEYLSKQSGGKYLLHGASPIIKKVKIIKKDFIINTKGNDLLSSPSRMIKYLLIDTFPNIFYSALLKDVIKPIDDNYGNDALSAKLREQAINQNKKDGALVIKNNIINIQELIIDHEGKNLIIPEKINIRIKYFIGEMPSLSDAHDFSASKPLNNDVNF